MTRLPDLIPAPDDAPDEEVVAGGGVALDPRGNWRITSTGSADWAMGRYVTAAATLDQLARQRADWLALVDDWYRTARAPADRTVEFFGGLLEEYALAIRAASELDAKGEPRTKSVPLVLGRVQTRKGSAESIEVADAEAFIAWAREADLWVTEGDALLLQPADDRAAEVSLSDYSFETRTVDDVTEWRIPLEWAVLELVWKVIPKTLGAYFAIVDRDVAPEGSDVPLITRVVISHDGEDVPGLTVNPPGPPTASVQPNKLAAEV